jgi:phosphoglycolate phosphatase-like HAD superfamily hydrolase
MKTVIFDIDGTLADIEHRRVYLDGDRPNWTKFNAHMGDDTPNIPVVELYHTLWASGTYDLQIVTGRNEAFRKVTETWLTWNEIPFNRVTMRADKDNRPDNIIKAEILQMMLAEGRDIAFAVDDRQQVVDMWRENGVTCLQCDVGDF